jgi:aldose 1-epimerase
VLEDPQSGRVLEVSTTQPGVQIYTGNWLAGCPANKEGRSYDDYDGVAIECQGLPDSINKPQFPSVVLRPSEEYSENITFKFTNK